MKKLVLVILVLSMGLLTQGQNLGDKKTTIGGPVNKYLMSKAQSLIGAKEGIPSFLSSTSGKNKLNLKNSMYGSLHSYYIKSSVNLYTLLVEMSTCLAANQNLNTIMFTCRDDHFTNANKIPCNIISSFRVNPDTIWTPINITSADTRGDRYPSGVIYNPTGNTDPKQAYSVITGPITSGVTTGFTWIGNYFGSGRLDNTNLNIQNISKTTYMQDMVRNGLTACDDGMIHVLGFDSIKSDTFKFTNVVMNNGSFNSGTNSFNWSHVKIKPKVYKKIVSNGNYNNVWSQDGSIGYVYFFGVDSVNIPNSYYPIVYESTDKGATWNELDYFDFSTLTQITSRISPIHNNSSQAIPLIDGTEASAVVDSTGNLHIFAVIKGSYTNNVDSIGYYYVSNVVKDPLDASVKPQIDQKIFDLYTKGDGTWGAQFIDSLHSQTVTATDALNSNIESGASTVGWDHRLQASRTATGGRIFLTWTDDDTLNTKDVANVKPNLIVYGLNLYTGLSVEKNFTLNVPYFDSQMLFDYAGNVTLNSGSQYTIPITFAKLNTTGNPADVIDNYFLDGVTINENDFITNVKNISNKNLISVSQNYPNPFRGSTSINFYLPKSNTVSLEVRNLLGQKVYEIPAEYESTGNHTLRLNTTNLQPGIYFYTFRANQFSVTKKMVIE